MAVGIGLLLFWGMWRGGGGMCEGLAWPPWPDSKPGAPAFGWGGGGNWEVSVLGPDSVIVKDGRQRWAKFERRGKVWLAKARHSTQVAERLGQENDGSSAQTKRPDKLESCLEPQQI